MTPSSDRPAFLTFVGLGGTSLALAACGSSPAQAKAFPVSMSEDAWRKKLTRAEFQVLRQESTERPYSSPLNEEKRKGVFSCAGCGNKVYPSRTKFESGTGWPSFWQVMSDNIGTKTDYLIGIPRTEYHCARCLGHQGHVFQDGPRTTGLRYCMNSASLELKADEEG